MRQTKYTVRVTQMEVRRTLARAVPIESQEGTRLKTL